MTGKEPGLQDVLKGWQDQGHLDHWEIGGGRGKNLCQRAGMIIEKA